MFKKLPILVLFVMFSLKSFAQTIVTDSISNSTSTTNSFSKSETTVKTPPPTAVAPAITSINNDLCIVGASGAVQTQILGLSFGATARDMNCERIKLSKNVYDMDMKVAADPLLAVPVLEKHFKPSKVIQEKWYRGMVYD